MVGRPKGAKSAKSMANEAAVSALAKTHAPSAMKALAEIAARGESEAARVSAANAILDRAYGKPAQAVTIGGDADKPLTMKHTYDVDFE